MNKKNWIRQISESYIQMNEMEETNPNPGEGPYYRYWENPYEPIDPESVRQNVLGELGGSMLAFFLSRGRDLSPAARTALQTFLMGGAMSLSGLLMALLAAGLTIYAAYEVISLLAQYIDEYNGTSPGRRIPPILPEHIRKLFPGGVPAPDPSIIPSALPANAPKGPMLPGQTYPGQHPIGPDGLPYIPTSSPSGTTPPGYSNPIQM